MFALTQRPRSNHWLSGAVLTMVQRLRRTLPAILLGLTAAAHPGWNGSSALTLAPPPDPALVAWYPFDGDPNDAIGTHHATLAGGSAYTPGVTGRALHLDGSTGHAAVPAFDMGSEWSVEAWVRPDACGDALHCPFFARSGGNFDGLLLAQVTGAHPLSGQFVFDIGNGAGWQLALASGATFAQRAWHHVVATRAGDTYALFVDGEQRAQQTVAGVSSAYQSLPIAMGHWNWGTQAFLGGALDEIRIYSRALAGTEIGTRYRTGIGIAALPFRDEFSATLRPAWRRTNEDAAALAVQASALQLTTTPTDMYGASNNVKNLAALRLPDVPGGYALTAKMSFQAPPGGANPQAGIALLADAGNAPDLDNYLRAVYGNETQRVFEAAWDINGAGNADIPNGPAFDVPADTPFWLRLVRAGSTLRAGYSFDGTQFTPFSTATTAAFAAGQAKPMAYAGIFALQGNGSSATPVDFEFDYAELTTTCSNLPAGLVSWWAGENGPQDATGANPGTAVGGVSYAAGRLGRAFLLDGSTGYVQNASPVGLPLGAAPRTMMLWFRTPVNLASATEAAMVQYGTTWGGRMFALITSGNAPGRLYFYGHGSDLAGLTSLLPDTWYHAAVTYDGATVRLYVNGQPDGQSAMGLDTQLSGDGLTIGLRHSGSRWQGEIDDVAIFDRALSAAEIAAVYQAGSTGACFAEPSPTSLQITSHLPHPSVVGTPVSVHVALDVLPPAGGTPTGTIEVSDGAAGCSIVLPATACDLTLASVGTATITAHYAGNSSFAASDAAGVAHTVVDLSAQSPLTVSRAGSGDGSVSSDDGTIDCGAACAHTYAHGTQLALTAAAQPDSTFLGWQGACIGNGPCNVSIAAATSVTATFALTASAPFTGDMERNNVYDALTDGLIVIRYLFGLRGPALTANAIGDGATRTDPAVIAAFLDDLLPMLDIDGNGRSDALTDGLMFLRYLFSIRGNPLTANALGDGATRTTPDAVEAAILVLLP